MATPDPYGAAQKFLAAVISAWNGKTLPANRYVAEGGQPAWDGEQVTVTVGAIRPGMPGQVTGRAMPPRAFPVSVELSIEIVRQRKAGLTRSGGRQTTLPTKAENRSAGTAYGGDLTTLLDTLLAIRENGSVVSHPTKIAINGVTPRGPEGDLVGVDGTVTILLGRDTGT